MYIPAFLLRSHLARTLALLKVFHVKMVLVGTYIYRLLEYIHIRMNVQIPTTSNGTGLRW
jgi:hypothetical protein